MSANQILVVEDEGIVATAIKNELEQFGYGVPSMASSAAEAVEKAVRDKPDLVLMDIHLKGEKDGIEAAAEIRRRCGIPVVYLSAFADPDTVARAGGTEAFGYLLKPYEERELQTTIEMALAKHRAEQRLEETERMLAAILEGIDDAVIATNSEHQVSFMNVAGEALTGWQKEIAVGTPIAAVCNLVEDGRRLRLEGLADRAVCQSRAVELPPAVRLATRNGKDTPIEGCVAPIYDRRGEFLGEIFTLRNITARLELERVRRKSGEQKREVDLNAVLSKRLGEIKPLLGSQIRVAYNPGSDLWPVNADVLQMGQVLLKLLLNAQDTMPHGGQLTLETGNVVFTADDAPDHPGGRPGEFVRMRVSDTGQGMSPEVRARLFEPFFTATEAGQGVGLGVAFVFTAIEQHHGWIECISEEGKGTRFDLYLPRYGTDELVESTPSTLSRPPGIRPTILLAEADATVRDFGRLMLEEQGYKVLVAEDGIQTVETFRRAAERIDLVVVDLNIPRLTGDAVLERLLELDPHVEVLFSSSYFAEDRSDCGSHLLGVISKPYGRKELVTMVRLALTKRQGFPGNTPGVFRDKV